MKVTVGVPTLGRLRFLREAIASVAAQTYRDFEVLVADNSADPSISVEIANVISEFSGIIPVRSFRHEARVNPVENFNSLLHEARGEYFAYLPDDDRLCPDFLEVQVSALESEPRARFAFCDHWIIREDGTIDREASASATRIYSRDLLQSGFVPSARLAELALRQSVCLQTLLCRREMLLEHPFTSTYLLVPDAAYIMELANSTSPPASFFNAKRLMEYRIHGDQESPRYNRIAALRTHIAVLERFPATTEPLRRIWRAKLARLHFSCGVLEFEHGDRAARMMHASRAFELSPPLRGMVIYAVLAATPPAAVPQLRGWLRKVRSLGNRAARFIRVRPRADECGRPSRGVTRVAE